MIVVVDKAGPFTIQKLKKPDGSVICYQVIKNHDGEAGIEVVARHNSLVAAREEIGKFAKSRIAKRA